MFRSGSKSHRKTLIVTIALPTLTGALLIWTIAAEQPSARVQLVVESPDHFRVNETIGVRARVVSDLPIADPKVGAAWIGYNDQRCDVRALAHSLRTDFEGSILALKGRKNRAICLITKFDSTEIHITKPLHEKVRNLNFLESNETETKPRAAPTSQRFRAEPLVSSAPNLDLERTLLIAIENGYCVPDVPCRILFSLDRAARLRWASSNAIVEGTTHTSIQRGIGSATIIVRGASANLSVQMVSMSDDVLIATRNFQLGLQMGGLSARMERRLFAHGESPNFSVEGISGRRPVYANLYADGIWRRAISFNETAELQLPNDLERGWWRVDLFEFAPDEPSRASLIFFVGSAEQATDAVHARWPESRDPVFERSSLDDQIAFFASREEERVSVLPKPIRKSNAIDESELRSNRVSRYLRALAIFLLGMIASTYVRSVGTRASKNALALLRAQGIDQPKVSSWPAVFLSLAILLIFLVIAILSLSHGSIVQ